MEAGAEGVAGAEGGVGVEDMECFAVAFGAGEAEGEVVGGVGEGVAVVEGVGEGAGGGVEVAAAEPNAAFGVMEVGEVGGDGEATLDDVEGAFGLVGGEELKGGVVMIDGALIAHLEGPEDEDEEGEEGEEFGVGTLAYRFA